MHKKFEPRMKYSSCMIRKSTLEDLPKLKDRGTGPHYQVNMDSFSSSVTSIEGYKYAVVLADCNSGYRCKSDMLRFIVKKVFCDIADLRK
jgi:hypothetical protein